MHNVKCRTPTSNCLSAAESVRLAEFTLWLACGKGYINGDFWWGEKNCRESLCGRKCLRNINIKVNT